MDKNVKSERPPPARLFEGLDPSGKDEDEDREENRRKYSGVGVEDSDQVPDLKEGRFARRMKNKAMTWTSEESYENDREVARSNDPKEKVLWAAEKNEMDLLIELIDKDPSLVNATDGDQYTPLHRACYNDHTEAIKLLLEHGASLEAKTIDGWTPLHCACKWDNVQSAAVLISAGANVNAATTGGQTALHLAANNREARETLELLLWQPAIDAAKKNSAGDLAKTLADRIGGLGGLFELVEPSVNQLLSL